MKYYHADFVRQVAVMNQSYKHELTWYVQKICTYVILATLWWVWNYTVLEKWHNKHTRSYIYAYTSYPHILFLIFLT
jgi:hypothetical protein